MSDLKDKVWKALKFDIILGVDEFSEYYKYTPQQCFDTAWGNTMEDVDVDKLKEYLELVNEVQPALGELFLQVMELATELKDEYKFPEEMNTVQ